MIQVMAADPYAKLRNMRNDATYREHLIILTALEELIAERHKGALQGQSKKGGLSSAAASRPTPNEYFAAIMTALEANDQSHTPELLHLLEAVIGSVDKAVLRAKYKPISGVLVLLLKTNLEHEMTAFVRDLVVCLGKLLLAQEVSNSAWSSPQMLKSFFVLITCFKEKRPKIRKAAMACTNDLLRLHASRKVWALGRQMAEFSQDILSSCTTSDCLSALHLLSFLQEGLIYFPEDSLKKVTKTILRLLSLENDMVVQASLQAFKALVKSEEAPLSETFLVQLTEQVLDVQPGRSEKNADVCCAFCDLVASCLHHVHQSNAKQAIQLLPRAIQTIVSRCEMDSSVVHESACLSLRLAFGTCTAETSTTLKGNDLKSVVDAIAAVIKLLEYRYQRSWKVTLPFLGSLFIHFKAESSHLLHSLLKKLAALHDAVVTAAPEMVKVFEGCIALAIEGLGIEQVLAVLPIEDDEGLATRRIWLLPLMTTHGKRQPASLGFFQSKILDLARKSNDIVTSSTAPLKQQQQHRARLLQLWGLLPAFCTQPTDISTSFGNLAPILANALQDSRYTELLGIICQSLHLLVHAVQASNNQQDLAALSTLSKKFLPTLFTILDNTTPDDPASGMKIRILSDTISAYASIAPKAFVASLFKKLVQKMLEATQAGNDGIENQSSKAVILCELAMALVPSLDQAGVILLYKVVRPLIRFDKDLALQKRAYRVLGALCEHQREAFLTPESIEELLPILTDSLLTCHVAARQMRLKVLGSVIQSLDGENQAHLEILAGLVGEVLLCLKDANAKAREAAYQTLSIMSQVKKEDDMAEFSQIVLAALAAETPHMRSAAVLALAHLIFTYGPQSPAFRATIPDLLSTILLLSNDPIKEVVKSVVSFIRICVAACPMDRLEGLLPGIIECLFASNSKVRFRAKIKIILKKLCRKFGYDHILQLSPETDKKLIHHIQKQALRGDRIAAEAAGEDYKQTKNFEAMVGDEEGEEEDSDEEEDDYAIMDDDDDEEEDGMRKKRGGGKKDQKGGNKRKRDEMMVREGGIVDLLDTSMIENLKLGGRGGKGRKHRAEEEDENDDEVLEFNEAGKLVIADDKEEESDEESQVQKPFDVMDMDKEDMDESDEDEGPVSRQKKHRREDGSAGFKGGKKSKGKQNAPGGNYKARKAGGDLRKKGQLEPYAYIPLNPKMISKKTKGEASKAFGAVVGNKKSRREERKESQGRGRKGGGRR